MKYILVYTIFFLKLEETSASGEYEQYSSVQLLHESHRKFLSLIIKFMFQWDELEQDIELFDFIYLLR